MQWVDAPTALGFTCRPAKRRGKELEIIKLRGMTGEEPKKVRHHAPRSRFRLEVAGLENHRKKRSEKKREKKDPYIWGEGGTWGKGGGHLIKVVGAGARRLGRCPA